MKPVICESLYNELNRLKCLIDEEPDKWEYRKRAINPYECIFSVYSRWGKNRSGTDGEWRIAGTTGINPQPFPQRTSVSSIHPISRAFFKMTELSDFLYNHPSHPDHPSHPTIELFKSPIRVLHLAESPGGFVQAWRWNRERKGLIDDAFAVTIVKQSTQDPWDKLREVSRRWKLPPELMTGDLFQENVRKTIISKYQTMKASLITADGGFDFSTDYCSQEEQATPLILAEVMLGMSCLQENGVMIIKVFDVVTLPMIQLLWVCWKCFKHFQLVKPATSRACNSERYIVVSGFIGMNPHIESFLQRCESILSTNTRPITTLFPSGLTSSWKTMNRVFRHEIEKSISELMTQQINTIQNALHFHTEEDDETRLKRYELYIHNAMCWCIKYNIPISQEHAIAFPRSLDKYICPRV